MVVHVQADPPAHPPDADKRVEGSSLDLNPFDPLDLRKLIPLREIDRHLPRRQDGRKLHRTTVGRWASRGCRGVVLRTWLVGGIRYTDADSLAEFVRRLTALNRDPRRPISPHPVVAGETPFTTSNSARRSASRRDRIEEDLKRFVL